MKSDKVTLQEMIYETTVVRCPEGTGSGSSDEGKYKRKARFLITYDRNTLNIIIVSCVFMHLFIMGLDRD